jgi:hypothetical protein
MAVMFNRLPRRVAVTLLIAVGLLFGDRAASFGQQAPPWTGVIVADEARADAPTGDGHTELRPKALSGDGRFLVFSSERTLVAGDTNGVADVFVRDRGDGTLTRVSVSTTGQEGNGRSDMPSISRDGRHITFQSCADNLVADDNNLQCDFFAHDRVTATTTLISSGPNSEPASFVWPYTRAAISADGRYVAFGSRFGDPPAHLDVWFRDRDSDGDGALDEPGETAMTRISQPVIGGITLFAVQEIAMSADGRWIAFNAVTLDPSTSDGVRMFLHDRTVPPVASGTVVVDTPQYPFTPQPWQFSSYSPDLADDGHLVYYSSMPGLVAGAEPGLERAYFVDPVTLQHTPIRQTHATNAEYFGWGHTMLPAVSADGRFVAYVESAGWATHTYVADMQTGVSYDVIPDPDGSWNEWPGIISMSADGAAVALEGTPAVFPTGNGYSGLYVANRIAWSPAEIDASNDGEVVTAELELPAWMPWTLDTSLAPGLESVTPLEGVGPATIEIGVPQNYGNEDLTHIIAVGPVQLVVRQKIPLTIQSLSPEDGPASGNDSVLVFGSGFKEGATLAFGGAPATEVQWWGQDMLYVGTPPHLAGAVDVVVTNPDGTSFTFEDGYTYFDDTPPVVEPIVTGTLGNNGWYRSNVLVQWSVVDEESAITEQYCDDTSITYDSEGFLSGCSATSSGGVTQAEIVIKRDATPPVIEIMPTQLTFYVGEAGSIPYSCDDAMSGVGTCQAGALNTTTAGSFSFTVTATDMAGNQSASSMDYSVIEKLVPVVTWPDPAPINTGTALGAAQLNATASVPGAFTYTPAAGTVLAAGTHLLSTTFTPADTVTYNTVTRTVMLSVREVPVITWANPSAITYPSALSTPQLNATANVAGSFAYAPPLGTVPNAGTETLSVTFTPEDTETYSSATKSVTIQVNKGNPGLTWASNAAIDYGTPLGPAIFSATANVPGALVYSHAEGTVLPAGEHTMTVTFTPADASNYNAANRTLVLYVAKQMPVVDWGPAPNITWGTALGPQQLNAIANVPGTFAYDPPAGTILEPGLQPLSVTFTPDDSANYQSTSRSTWQNVSKATPVLTWNDPAPIVYGTVLGSGQNNATANVAGGFGYFPASGNTLAAGPHTLSVTFTPTDSTHYTNATASVTLVVDKRTPLITWNNPAAITYGAALGATQLSAAADVAGGSFQYSPAGGTVLNAGSGQTLTVTYSMGSPNYNDATKSVTIDVLPATPAVTWNNPAAITYLTTLSATQLNATATVAGTFAYAPAAGTQLGAGTHTLSVTFTPSSGNYTTATRDVTIVVGKATPAITWNTPAEVTYGTALSGAQLNATANVAGSFAYSPAPGTVLNAGPQTLTATFTPSDSANYDTATANVTLAVAKATPVVAWNAPGGITYGTALSGSQLNATATVAGSFAYSPASGTVLGAGTQALSVTFTPADTANYNSANGGQSIAVAKQALTVTTNNASKVYGQALPAFAASGSGFVNGDTMASLVGTLSFSTSATATSAPGAYSVTPGGVSSTNYSIAFANGTLTISKANTTTTLTSSPSPSNHNQNVTLTATVAAIAPGAGVPTGTITFRDNGTVIGSAALVNGVATMNKNLKRGSHPLTATYTATTNFNGSVGSKTHQVN